MNNDLKIILGDYESFVQSHTIEINEKEVIYCITLKRTIISCPECSSSLHISLRNEQYCFEQVSSLYDKIRHVRHHSQ